MFNVDVSYGLREYQSFLRDFVPITKVAHWRGIAPHEVEPGSAQLPRHERVGLWLAGLASYFYKTRKLGRCTFTVDEQGLSRESRLGTLTVAWEDVPCVYELRRAFLFAVNAGAVPIPYRVLTAEQTAELRALLERNGVKVVRQAV